MHKPHNSAYMSVSLSALINDGRVGRELNLIFPLLISLLQFPRQGRLARFSRTRTFQQYK